jgi:hypothetical protein
MQVRPARSLPLGPTGRFSGRYFPDFPDLNPPTGTKKHASNRSVVCMEKKNKSDTKYKCSDCNVSLCPAPFLHLSHTSRAKTEHKGK